MQGSFQTGGLGVETVVRLIDEEKVDKMIDTGVDVVTKGHIDASEAENVLYRLDVRPAQS